MSKRFWALPIRTTFGWISMNSGSHIQPESPVWFNDFEIQVIYLGCVGWMVVKADENPQTMNWIDFNDPPTFHFGLPVKPFIQRNSPTTYQTDTNGIHGSQLCKAHDFNYIHFFHRVRPLGGHLWIRVSLKNHEVEYWQPVLIRKTAI